jgi:hypothetical protein
VITTARIARALYATRDPRRSSRCARDRVWIENYPERRSAVAVDRRVRRAAPFVHGGLAVALDDGGVDAVAALVYEKPLFRTAGA